MNIVLDTNCLLVAVYPSSPYYWLWQAFRDGRFTLCYTNEIVQEYHEKLTHFYTPHFAQLIIEELFDTSNTHQVTPTFRWHLINVDPDDNKFVDCAIAANAAVVTNDKHFNVLREVFFPPVTVLGIDDFRKVVRY